MIGFNKNLYYIIVFAAVLLTRLHLFAQGGPDCATALGAPLTLPFTGTNLTNCGSLDDYDNTNTVLCGSGLYYSGEDHLYAFTPTTTGPLMFQLTTTSNSTGMFLFDGCPNTAPNCLANSESFAGGGSFMFTVTAGQTYFIMIDSWSPPTCHPLYDLYIGPPLPPNNQDCLGAIPVCQSTYTQNNSYNGEGNIPNEIDNTNSCLGSGELNDVWYTFTVQQSGLLNFSITPNQMTDDYDWAVYDLTNANCEDIATNPLLEVSCNYSGASGITGANGLAGTQNNPPIPVTAGQIFVLNVSNFSSTQFGYTLNFGASTASIFDLIPPVLDSIVGGNPDCGDNTFQIRFSENVLCNTVDPSDFILNGPGGPYVVTQAFSVACQTSATYDNIFTLVLANTIQGTGNFFLDLVGPVSDLCGNIAVPTTLPFQIPGFEPFAGMDRNICQGDTAHMNASGGSAYLWSPTTGLSDPNIANPIANPTVSTMYVVRFTIPCPFQYVYDTVWVNVLSPPIVDAGPDTFFCEGSGGVQLNATVTGGIAPYTYVWMPSNGNLSDFNATDPVANPDTNQIFYFYAVGFNGCRSATDSINITVYELPVVDAGSDLEFCQDAPGVFLQGSIVNVNGGYSVQWLPTTGLFCDTCLVTYAQPTTTTAYTLRVTSLATGCTSDSTTLNTLSSALVIVKPRPIVYAGADTLICQGDSARLFGSYTGAGPLYTFEWAPGHGMAVTNTVSTNASPAYTTPYYLVATSNGCESIADTVLVVVRPVPILTGGNTKNICKGDSVQLDAQVQQGIAQAYRWTPGSGLSDSTILKPMASPAVTTTYTLRAYNGSCPSLPENILVVVHDVPQASLPNDTTLCSTGDSIQLKATVTGGTFPYTMQWSPSAGLGNPISISTNALPNITTMYYYTVSSGSGPTLCASTDSVLITIVPGVLAQLVADTGIICPGGKVQLQASGGVGNATFQWYPSNGLSNPMAAITSASPDTTTTYKVLVSEGQCKDSAQWTINVHPEPRAGFTLSQPNGCSELGMQFNDWSANTIAHQWNFGDGTPVSNELNPYHTYTQSGNYTVTLVVKGVGGCIDTLHKEIPVQLLPGIKAIVSTDPPSPVELFLPSSEVRVEDNTEVAVSWKWSWGDGSFSDTRTARHTYLVPGAYYINLEVMDAAGCRDLIRLGPYIMRPFELDLPNVFTPNGDGIHDVFRIQYSGDELFHFQVFDRWGVKYFDTRNKEQGWDGLDLNGSAAQTGVYFYQLSIGSYRYQGEITLVR